MEEALGGREGLQGARTQVAGLGTLLDGLATDLLKQDTGGQPALKDRIDGLRRQCVRAKEELGLLFLHDHDNFVRWGSHAANRSRRGPATTLNWTPISVAPLLAESFWKAPRNVGAALVSATLSTGGGFNYVRERLGVPEDDPKIAETVPRVALRLRDQLSVFISPPTCHRPSDEPGYMSQVTDEIIALVDAAGGGAFILFTSYRALNIAYEHLTQSDLPYPLLRQGEMPNARLVQAFKTEKNAVLLGTQSFWEGVDVPGMGLRLVIIDRIPFAVPDSPLHKARVDSITQAGGDWFRDFAMPQAQLRLKQGFGRLIRTQSDRGVVAVLDTRLIRKSYGSDFLRFLPPARRASEIEAVREFFAEAPSQCGATG